LHGPIELVVWTVGQVTAYLKNLLQTDPLLQDAWVEGEVSNCVRSTAGHTYFTLKDAAAELRCVIWHSMAVQLEHLPSNGEAVIAHGRTTVYEARGVYQLQVDALQPRGTGILFLQFQALKQKLEKEGLFAPEHKRALPEFPRRLGVVTSPRGAALRDILNVLRRRYAQVQVIVAPTLVQGEEAPPQIVMAIEALNNRTDVEAIIVARGGGSLEELWAFNDERVARAIYESRVPVVTGIGHETDFTIADFVADVRAPTPSAAAEIATPDQEALRAQIQDLTEGLFQAMRDHLAERRAQAIHAVALLRRASPRALLDRQRQQLDDCLQRMQTIQRHRLDLWRGRVRALEQGLQTLNPESTLKRGYAIVSRGDTGAVVARTAQVALGDPILVRVSDGSFSGTVGESPASQSAGDA